MTIYAKLATASNAMGTLIKSSFNKFEGYAYVSCDDVIYTARKALSEAGLVFFECGCECVVLESPSEGGEGILMVRSRYVVADPENGDQLEFGCDVPIHTAKKGVQLDKQSAASRTYSLAYALRGLLLADRVEEARPMDEVEPDKRPKDDGANSAKPDEKVALWAKLKELKAKHPEVLKGRSAPKSIEELRAMIAEFESVGD